MIFKRRLKSYSVSINYEELSQIVTIVAPSRRKALKGARQLWEPYISQYDTEWTETKKKIKYKIHDVRRIR